MAREPSQLQALLADEDSLRDLARTLVRDGSRADDIVQDAYCVYLRRPPVENASAGVGPWFRSVMRNLARRQVREDDRRRRREERAARSDVAQPASDAADRLEMRTRLAQAVLDLPEIYRDVVLLRYYEGLSAAEVARRTGLEPGTVRLRLHRAIARLRGLLTEQGTGVQPRVARRGLLLLANPSPTRWTSLIAGGALVNGPMKLAALGLLIALGWWLAQSFVGEPKEESTAPTSSSRSSASVGTVGEAGSPTEDQSAPSSVDVHDDAARSNPEGAADSAAGASTEIVILARFVDPDGRGIPGVELTAQRWFDPRDLRGPASDADGTVRWVIDGFEPRTMVTLNVSARADSRAGFQRRVDVRVGSDLQSR